MLDDSLVTAPPLLPARPSQLLSLLWLSKAPKCIHVLVLHKGKVMVFLPLFCLTYVFINQGAKFMFSEEASCS